MNWYRLSPEIPGELGENTVMDTDQHPPVISRLHFVFTNWLGDDLVECFPVFLVSENLKKSIEQNNLTGVSFSLFEQTIDEMMNSLRPGIQVPLFFQMHVTTVKNDFFINTLHELVVSEKALLLLRRFTINYCDVIAFDL